MSELARLHPADLERLADLFADRLADRVLAELGSTRADRSAPTHSRLLTVAEVASWLGLSRDQVYRMRVQLGAVKLGSGPKAPVRFDAQTVSAWLAACSVSKESANLDRPVPPRLTRQCTPPKASGSPLLPVRGV